MLLGMMGPVAALAADAPKFNIPTFTFKEVNVIFDCDGKTMRNDTVSVLENVTSMTTDGLEIPEGYVPVAQEVKISSNNVAYVTLKKGENKNPTSSSISSSMLKTRKPSTKRWFIIKSMPSMIPG